MKTKPTVIDFFCGAGGFSEGFRQQGFDVIKGIDNWKPAVDTHNLNHDLLDKPVDILNFEVDDSLFDFLPNTDVIIGSPPCVDFSMSNKAGKAQKGLGIRLIETYLRIVAVKKHQRGSTLKAWLMENVPNSRNFVQEKYTFQDLGLGTWAKKRWPKAKRPETRVALHVKENGAILNAADYGSPQGRKRFVCGEVVKTGQFPKPKITRSLKGDGGLKRYVWLKDIKGSMPLPTSRISSRELSDPNYPLLRVKARELTDHFYDTGIYEIEWKKAKALKVNHPFMGKMSFPEDENRPSRTIMATRSSSTRETMVFRSEFARTGDGEYRLPTIREAASLMGFPFSYQFLGGEGTKWRLIGNAVCPHMASALAQGLRKEIWGKGPVKLGKGSFASLSRGFAKVNNLNSVKEKEFTQPPKRSHGAKFRHHPFKQGNMTVALTNYLPDEVPLKDSGETRWYASMFMGSGETYKVIVVTDEIGQQLDKQVNQHFPRSYELRSEVNTKILAKVAGAQQLQEMFEQNRKSTEDMLNPVDVVDEIGKTVVGYAAENEFAENVKLNGFTKTRMPIRQLLAAWALGLVVEKIQNS